MKVGYVRVSKREQHKDLQIDALTKAGCEKIFIDEISGVQFERKGLNELLNFIRAKDIIVVWRMDRLGRKLIEVLKLVEDLEKRQIDLISCTQQIDTTTPIGKFFFHMTAVYADFERETLIERTNAGLAAARARGRVGGRKKKLNPKQAAMARSLYQDKTIPIADICTRMGINRSTLNRYVKDLVPTRATAGEGEEEHNKVS